jgi:hypothetical protein
MTATGGRSNLRRRIVKYRFKPKENASTEVEAFSFSQDQWLTAVSYRLIL